MSYGVGFRGTRWRARRGRTYYKGGKSTPNYRETRIVRAIPRTMRTYKNTGIYSAKNAKEVQFFDVTFGTALTTTLATMLGGTQACNSIAQSDNNDGRSGNQVTITSFQIRGYFTSIAAAATLGTEVDNVARLMCFVDHQCNGIITNAADILETTTAINSHRQLDNTDQITMLFDKTQDINAQVVWDATANTFDLMAKHYSFTFYKKMNMKVKYNGTGGTLSTIVTNAINVFAMMEDTLCDVSIFAVCRCRFTR